MKIYATTNDKIKVKLHKKILKHSLLLKNILKLKKKHIFLKIESNTLKRIEELLKIIDLKLEEDYLDCEVSYNSKLIDILQEMDGNTFSSIVEGVDYLNIPFLVEYCAFVVCKMLKDKKISNLTDFFKKKESDFEKMYLEKIKLKNKQNKN
ncbi:hypothetical protein TUBRATIS_002200 [Tubulinosema ratisbonensis]|uniref:Uncharacterized protein n=1 Tax=Tubulinosema ratisbonensis TaxID=291195 RepID=A0A437APW6_9MICR|nr:hypothetical protein TUBRATIS_002200 [Tubulinosema ratisbonensis]